MQLGRRESGQRVRVGNVIPVERAVAGWLPALASSRCRSIGLCTGSAGAAFS